ncbi:MAG TPA: anthrone oxygenase family protein [Dongiaceae bacterium]|jgi:uncharacterized membrane protein|nr:anthrone oxygenase family protein [Dongiaceae bacterium]
MFGCYAILIAACALGCGLNAGVFFAFSTFVMQGLTRLAPSEGINAMKAINVTAVTPIFMTLLFGTGVLCAVAIIAAVWPWNQANSAAVMFGGVMYLSGAIITTMMRNVPLNGSLARLAPGDPSSASVWNSYVRDWTKWNHLRTFNCAGAMVLFIFALWQQAKL